MSAAISSMDMGRFRVDLRTDEKCSTLTHLDLAIAPSSTATESVFIIISGTKSKPEIFMSANMGTTKPSAQAMDRSSRKVCAFEQSPAVLPSTTDLEGIDTKSD